MLWRRSARTPTPSLAPSVPHGEALRLSVLQASWKRDRRVARRRLAWRWLMWASWRYVVPAVCVLMLIMFAVVPALSERLSPADMAHRSTPNVQQPSPRPPTTKTQSEHPPDTAHVPPVPVDQPNLLPDSTPAFTPHLKPENGLYSKEP